MARKGPYYTHSEALEAAGKNGTVERDGLWWVVTGKDADKAKEVDDSGDNS